MDNWEAPQWADFNATVMSDIEDFFQTEHETHERRRSSESFDDSGDSDEAASPAPRADFSIPMPKSACSSPMPKGEFSTSVPKRNFSTPLAKINFSKSAPKSVGSFLSPMPKGGFASPIPKKVGNFSSPMTSRVTRSGAKKGGEIFSSAIDALSLNSEKNTRARASTALENAAGNFVCRDNGEEDTGENNRTLVAEEGEAETGEPMVATEKNEELERAEEKLVVRDGENSEILQIDSTRRVSGGEENKTDNISHEAKTVRLEPSETKKSGENLSTETEASAVPEDKFSEEERSKLDERTPLDCPVVEKKEENLQIVRSDADGEIIALSESKSEDKISAAEKSKLVKLVSQLDPPRRSISENKPADNISGEEKSKLAKLVSQLDPPKRPVPENKSEKMSGAEKLKLAKLVSQLDPPKRPILETKSGAKVPGEEGPKAAKLSQPKPPKLPVGDGKNASRAPAKSRVLTSQVRRYSISKHRRRSNQYVSLAEAVSKFQTGTPKRFRSTNRKDDKAGPVLKTKQAAVKLTCPMSPALLCKFRARAVSVPCAEEREKLEIEEIRKNRLRPNPIVRRPRTQSDSCVGKNSRAPRTTGKIRQASAEKKTTEPSASSGMKTAMDPPRGTARVIKKPGPPSADHTASIKASETSRPTVPAAAEDSSVAPERKKEAHLLSTSMSKHTPRKKMIPSLVATEDGPVIKNVEILHFGIPINNDYKNKNITRTMPFSFDTRNKESQSKREKLKSRQIEDDKSRKSTFHARPAPAFAKAAPPAAPRESENEPSKPMLCPLSFRERNELLLRKKKKMIEEAVEREKKARVFHAKPAPPLRPVFVRGASAENLRAPSNAEGGKRKSRGLSPAARQRGLSQDSVVSNQENKPPNLPRQTAPQCPKLKNPLMGQSLVIKKTTGGK